MVRARRKRLWVSLVLLSLGVIFGWVRQWFDPGSAAAGHEIERLYAEKRSGIVVEGHGVVSKLLSDDRDGSRHQRFVLRLSSGHTLLVSHNIDLAPRVPDIGRGDRVEFRGQYEWNDRGGVLHWTHRDPDGDRPGGWLEHGGTTYH